MDNIRHTYVYIYMNKHGCGSGRGGAAQHSATHTQREGGGPRRTVQPFWLKLPRGLSLLFVGLHGPTDQRPWLRPSSPISFYGQRSQTPWLVMRALSPVVLLAIRRHATHHPPVAPYRISPPETTMARQLQPPRHGDHNNDNDESQPGHARRTTTTSMTEGDSHSPRRPQLMVATGRWTSQWHNVQCV